MFRRQVKKLNETDFLFDWNFFASDGEFDLSFFGKFDEWVGLENDIF